MDNGGSRLLKSKDIAANKLIILYIMCKLNMAASNIQLTKYVLEQHMMDFFSFQQHINEMVADGYLDAAPDEGGKQRTLYRLTKSGMLAFDSLKGLMPRAEKNRVDRTISPVMARAKDELAVSAEYMPIDENRQNVCLRIAEGDATIMKIEMQTASKGTARQICGNWKKRTPDIYAQVIAALMPGFDAKKWGHNLES
jgi:hypothetical protein